MKNLSISKAHLTFAVVISIAALSLIFTACAPANLSASASDSAAAVSVASNPDQSAASTAQGQSLITNAVGSTNQYIPMIIAAVVAVIAVFWFRRRKSKA